MKYLKELEKAEKPIPGISDVLRTGENIVKMCWWLHENRDTDISIDDMASKISEIENEAVRNLCVEKARELHALIVPNENLKYVHDPRKVLEILDKISLSEGKALKCYLASMSDDGLGSISHLYVSDIDEPAEAAKPVLINEIWKNIIIDPCGMALWQSYLLMTTIHVMPYWWHGGYNKRTFVLSPEDLKSIKALNDIDLSHLSEGDLQPNVTFVRWDEEMSSGRISNTYWSEWDGLIKERIVVGIKGNRITSYGVPCKKVLFKDRSIRRYL